MRRTVLLLALILALAIGIECIGVQILYAQKVPDSRIADLVKAGKLSLGLGLGVALSASRTQPPVQCAGRRWTSVARSQRGSVLSFNRLNIRDLAR